MFTVINLVLKSFSKPLLQLLQHTSNLLLTNAPGDATSTPELRAQAQVLLVDLYYDLTCQDLPPDFEDTHAAFFGPPEGLFLKFLVWDPPQLQGDVSWTLLYARNLSLTNSYVHCSLMIPLHRYHLR